MTTGSGSWLACVNSLTWLAGTLARNRRIAHRTGVPTADAGYLPGKLRAPLAGVSHELGIGFQHSLQLNTLQAAKQQPDLRIELTGRIPILMPDGPTQPSHQPCKFVWHPQRPDSDSATQPLRISRNSSATSVKPAASLSTLARNRRRCM